MKNYSLYKNLNEKSKIIYTVNHHFENDPYN